MVLCSINLLHLWLYLFYFNCSIAVDLFYWIWSTVCIGSIFGCSVSFEQDFISILKVVSLSLLVFLLILLSYQTLSSLFDVIPIYLTIPWANPTQKHWWLSNKQGISLFTAAYKASMSCSLLASSPYLVCWFQTWLEAFWYWQLGWLLLKNSWQSSFFCWWHKVKLTIDSNHV